MSFLDRFKPQPRWKHADPAVRAAAVAEIPDDPEHRGVIEELARDGRGRARPARGGRSGRGRRGAGQPGARRARCGAPPPDRRTAGGDRDRPAPTPTATPRSRSTGSTIRNSSRPSRNRRRTTPSARRRSDACTTSRRSSSVARHAADPQTALDAVARIADPAELLNIALKTDHKDAGIAALERPSRPGG